MATKANKLNMMDKRSRYSAFYNRPSCINKTSAEIVSEAREAMEHKKVRAVHTNRPFTPKGPNRTLFGRNRNSRPPSAISLGQVKFHDFESSLPRLSSSNTNFMNDGANHGRLNGTRLPAITDIKRNKQLKLARSLDNLPEESEADDHYGNNATLTSARLAYSSPKERTLDCKREKYSDITHSHRGFNATKHKERVDQPFQNWQHITEESEEDPANTPIIQETFPPVVNIKKQIVRGKMDFKSIAFSERRGSPLDILGMDKLIETTENVINEARAHTNEHIEDNEQREFTVETITESYDSIENILDELKQHNPEERNDINVIPVFFKLYLNLERENISSSKNNKLKSLVLKSIYKFVEQAGEELLLHIARIALMLRVNGNNLSSVCKLIFKVSRADKNDQLFQDVHILELFLEALGRASPLDDAEACIYGYGALKFLSMNSQLLHILLHNGALELMVLHIKIVNNARLDLISIPEQTSHAMFQMTGALRNVASEEGTFAQFVETGAVHELCRSLEFFSADLDLVCNIARTLSILSTNQMCCQNMICYANSFRSITKVLNKFPGRQDIVVRLGYALGNIMAKCHEARISFYNEPGALETILDILESYLERELDMMSNSDESDIQLSTPELISDGSTDDVLVKMIRVIANMSLHPNVGVGLTCSSGDGLYTFERTFLKNGARFIDILLTVLRRKSVAESEELILSTLSTLNNLSFYADPEATRDSPFGQRQLEIAEALSALLLTRSDECLIEVTRVLGNLTRSKETRDYVLETGGICQLVKFLSRENKELVCTVSGVLVNLMADWDKRLAFKEDDGIHRLIVALEKYGFQDWWLSCLACQALWNFCIDSTNLYAALGVQPTNHLLSVLIDLLDEETIFGVRENGEVDASIANSLEYQQWEQFAAVATNLLEKIEQYLESLQGFSS